MGCFLPRVSSFERLVMPSRALKEIEISDVKQILTNVEWVPPIHDIRVESDIDSLGDPALWVWIVYDVDEVNLEVAHQVERKIQRLVSEAGDERWVYVKFRTREEDVDTDEDNDEGMAWPDDSCKSLGGSVNS
jgi:hypothetical protein